MKKLSVLLTDMLMVLSAPGIFALGTGAYSCTVLAEDMSETSYQLYLSGCSGHYDAAGDSVTLYITNTCSEERSFQLTVGYSGDQVQTTVESGFVVLPPQTTGKFQLTELSRYPEKANDELGYVPNSHLSGSSVVRIQMSKAEEGDSFVITGLDGYANGRDSGFGELSPQALTPCAFDMDAVLNARLVIKDEGSEDNAPQEEFGISAEQPDLKTVDTFVILTVCSAILCTGGLILYGFTYISKRRKRNDREGKI